MTFALPRRCHTEAQPIILLTSEGRPWTEDGFRASFNKARDKAGLAGLTFSDFWGTAVARLVLEGCTVKMTFKMVIRY